VKAYIHKPLTAAMLVSGFYLILRISNVERWDGLIWVALLLLCMDAYKDQQETTWLRFLPIGLILLLVPFWIYMNAADMWWKVADWQMTSVRHLWNWDAYMTKIPLNDPGSIWQKVNLPWVTQKAVWVYGFGFAFTIWAAVIRSFLARDWRKMLHYTLATHVLQTPLIIPFYSTIELHEVWWVLHRADALSRPSFMDAYHLKLNAQNCFPSMHTSIAFAVILLALREKGPIFKWGMVAYGSAVIISTLYLDIHWTVDVLAGLAFGYGVVRLSDWVMAKVPRSWGSVRPAAEAADLKANAS